MLYSLSKIRIYLFFQFCFNKTLRNSKFRPVFRAINIPYSIFYSGFSFFWGDCGPWHRHLRSALRVGPLRPSDVEGESDQQQVRIRCPFFCCCCSMSHIPGYVSYLCNLCFSILPRWPQFSDLFISPQGIQELSRDRSGNPAFGGDLLQLAVWGFSEGIQRATGIYLACLFVLITCHSKCHVIVFSSVIQVRKIASRLTDRSVDWLIDFSHLFSVNLFTFDCLVDWLFVRLIHRFQWICIYFLFIFSPIDRFWVIEEFSIYFSVIHSISLHRSIYWLIDWLIGRLFDWLIDLILLCVLIERFDVGSPSGQPRRPSDDAGPNPRDDWVFPVLRQREARGYGPGILLHPGGTAGRADEAHPFRPTARAHRLPRPDAQPG